MDLQEILPGIWFGEVTQEDKNGSIHGKWLIGNTQPEGSPGYHPDIMYKRWVAQATDSKYTGAGHTPDLPAHKGRTEYVQVIRGLFACRFDGQLHVLRRYPEDDSDLGHTDLGPDVKRTWLLPDESCGAEGFTLCRFRPDSQTPGAGEGYALQTLEIYSTDAFISHCLPKRPPALAAKYHLLDVYEGSFRLISGAGKYLCTVCEGDHVFLSDDASHVFLQPNTNTVRVVLVSF